MIHVERAALGSILADHLEKENIAFSVADDISAIPDEKNEIILIKKRDLYAHPCPGTKIYRCCNYHTSDVMEGCPFDCSYCILQAYLGHKNILVSSDTDRIANDIRSMSAAGVRHRLGTGELSDSLALDNIFPFTKIIIPLINGQDTVQFEFKTKSANIKNLLNMNPHNIVVAWSLNPDAVASAEEHGAAPVQARIEAARICAEAGYRIAFHFDPLVWHDGWQSNYNALLENLFNSIPQQSVEYISVSTFRTTTDLMDRMRARSTPSALLKSDMITGLDGKLRYYKALRVELLKNITLQFDRYWPDVFVYYCMEHSSIWETLKGFDPGGREEFERLFPHNRRGCRG